MGNCMETCMQWPVAELQLEEVKEEEGAEKQKGGVRIKVVLTREELEWLILELKGQKSGSTEKRSLEDVLAEIERSRASLEEEEERWKPSLHSIPELPEMDRCL